jgi:TPP-dependent pyruvate/acetoin dehydrogenase alpha subunit
MIERDKLLNIYRKMNLIRAFERSIKQLSLQGKIPGWFHLSIGMEAVSVGACSVLRTDDYVTSTHRGHGHCIAKGAEVKLMMAELYAKKTGYCKTKGGSMHISAPEIGLIGCTAIVGAGIPIATGAGLSAKLRGSDQVSLAFFGDGASNQGVFHESINLASIWKLPVVYICENNQFGEYTRVQKHRAAQSAADFATVYRIQGMTVDGNDVLAVYDAAEKAVKHARRGNGPTILECVTCRLEGHWVGDESLEGFYRNPKELEDWRKKDPIERFKKELTRQGILTPTAVAEIDDSIKREIDDAIRFAEESPPPEPGDALKDVFVSPYY